MFLHKETDTQFLFRKIKSGEIVIAGNKQLKIYGTLHCKSGKRMKLLNRVFFTSVKDAEANGYRPCGHCMQEAYSWWKQGDR